MAPETGLIGPQTTDDSKPEPHYKVFKVIANAITLNTFNIKYDVKVIAFAIEVM